MLLKTFVALSTQSEIGVVGPVLIFDVYNIQKRSF